MSSSDRHLVPHPADGPHPAAEPRSALPAEPPPTGHAPPDRELDQWQRRLLPLMVWMLGGLSVVFLLATLYQLNSLQARIEAAPTLDLAPTLARLNDAATPHDRLVYAEWQTLALLEQQTLERRYHQANVLLMARTWTSYLGFLTGMILAIVGATFILGKLREEASALRLQTPGAEANLRTTSPGIVLCVLGTVLILGAILTHNPVETSESGPLFLRTVFTTAAGPSSDPAPPPGESSDPFEELERLNPVPADPTAEPR
jgi:hypothetical protein